MVIKETAAMIANMRPELVAGEFLFCTTDDPTLSATCLRFALGVFRENEGVSFILQIDHADMLGFEIKDPMRQITLNVFSALDGVGLTAAVSGALARIGVPCNVVAAYHHDHIFVPTRDADRAIHELIELSR